MRELTNVARNHAAQRLQARGRLASRLASSAAKKDGNCVRYSIADESVFALCEMVCGGLHQHADGSTRGAGRRAMIFRQLTHDDLGCASYLVGDEDAGVAAVVDPRLDVDEYLRLARYLGVRIEHILETHNHADHVSGHGRLAAATGATVHIHRDAAPDYAHEPFDDGWELGARRAHASARSTRPATGPSTPPSR